MSVTASLSLDQRFANTMGSLLGPEFPNDIALAVSGGGDSMAMLALAHNWSRLWGLRLWVVTVDHGLRPESAEECVMVAGECAALGWPHAVLHWRWDGQGNVMDAARRARLRLIDQWRGGIRHVLMAHTQDDVAETFVMRVKRGSGVDGLSAMAPLRRIRAGQGHKQLEAGSCTGAIPNGARGPWMHVVRPCLEMSRADLRHYLRTLSGRWVEDPTNDDPAFERARLRKMLSVLQDAGLSPDRIAQTASRLREDRVALAMRAQSVWNEHGSEVHGTLWFAPDWHAKTESATQRRLLNAALRYVAGADYGPRADALDALRDRIVSGGGGTLHGCEARYLNGRLCVFREYAVVLGRHGQVGDGTLWDDRWRISDSQFNGLTVRALGEDGWKQLGPRDPGSLPFHAALSLPSIWDGDRLVVCDAMYLGPGDTTTLAGDAKDRSAFSRFLLSH